MNGDTLVETTDRLVHEGNRRGMAEFVFAQCGRLVCLKGLGSPEARQRGAEAGWVVDAPSMVTCIRCWSGISDWDEGWRYKPLRGVR